MMELIRGVGFYVLGSTRTKGYYKERPTSWEIMEYLNPYKGKLFLKKFSKVFLVPFNARCCLYRVLSGPFGGNYMRKESHSEESVK